MILGDPDEFHSTGLAPKDITLGTTVKNPRFRRI